MEQASGADDAQHRRGLEVDESLGASIQHAPEAPASEDRLRGLLQANRRVVSDLDLDVVLNTIVATACELVEADYGALGVIGPEGAGLERFVHVGLDEQTISAIGHLPEGKGLLGLLIDDPRPI